MNSAVSDAFFGGRFRLAPLYLDLEGEVLHDIAALLGIAADDCAGAIAAAAAESLTWSRRDPFQRHLDDLEAWTELGCFDAPPFTALLATLSLAAERMRADAVYSAHNYYERLFELLGVSDEQRKNALKHHAASMRVLWEALNGWLASNDYEAGRPTAKQVNDWKYASYALSQALVREADRRRLRSLFPEYGLAPHEQVTEAEMTIYLHEWMRGPGPSAWLRKVWSTPDLRPRVAAAACAELEAWEGSEADAAGTVGRRRLSWAATFQSFPRRTFRMFLAAAADAEAQEATFSLPAGSSAAATAAFSACSAGLWLTPSAGDVAVLEPTRDIALSPLMLAAFELRAADGTLALSRSARPVVPLVKLDTGALYREVSRISLLRPHLVLCHQEWAARVDKLLAQNARAGFQPWSSADLPGVPAEWVLYSGVEMLRAAQSANADMQALVPLAEGAALEFAGGLRLSYSTWHSKAPPEATAAASSGPLSLRVADRGDSTLAVAEWNGPACRLNLADHSLPAPGDFKVEVRQAGRIRREATVSLRSAAHPRPLGGSEAPAYHLGLDDPAASMLAAAQPPRAGLAVRGMTLAGVVRQAAAEAGMLPESAGPVGPGSEEPSVQESAEYSARVTEGLKETCVLRGHHFWICEEFRAGEHQSDDKWMACSDCRNRVLTRNRTAVRKRPGPLRAAGAAAKTGAVRMNARKEEAPDPNLVLDALCWLGAGSWVKLEDLASSQGGAPWLADGTASALCDLGHIDISGGSTGIRPASWTIAPPALVFARPGRAFLAGFRNEGMVAEAAARAAAAGGILASEAQDGGPDTLVISGLTAAAAAEALEVLSDPHGRSLQVVEDFLPAVARAAPPASAIGQAMRRVHIEAPRDLHRFAPAAGTWEPASRMDQPGAYRTAAAGRRYVFLTPSGECLEGTYQLVKLLAAQACGVRLHGYDPHRRTFAAALGCAPPGLFARALVSASGRLPRRDGGRLLYEDIDPPAAALILSKLYS